MKYHKILKGISSVSVYVAYHQNYLLVNWIVRYFLRPNHQNCPTYYVEIWFQNVYKKQDLILSRTYLSCAREKKKQSYYFCIDYKGNETLHLFFPPLYNMCVSVVRNKIMKMFGQRVNEKIGIKTSSL